MNAAIGQGIGDGLAAATNTLLQIQMYKQKQAKEAERDKIKDKYDKSKADYEDMMVESMRQSSQSYIDGIKNQAVTDYVSKQGKGGTPTASQGGNPIAAASSTLSGQGSLPETNNTPTYTSVPDGKGHYKTIINNQSPDQAVETYKKAVAAADKAGLKDVNISLSATGKVTISKETGFQQRTDIAKQTAPAIEKALKGGDFTAYKNSDPMVKDLVGKMMADEGISIDKISQNYTKMQKLASTSGGTQMTRFNGAVKSLTSSLNVLDRLSDDYQRSDFLPTLMNKIQITYDKETGTDGKTINKPKFVVNQKDFKDYSQYQKALAYLSQMNFTKDQLVFVYTGGFAGTQDAWDMARDTVSPLLGNVGERTVSNQIRVEMAIRNKSLNDVLAGKTDDSGDDGSGGQGDNQSQDVPTIVNAEGKTMKLSPDGKSWI
jgi:hypothetical protein